MDVADFQRFLHERIKVNGKTGQLAGVVKVSTAGSKVNVATKLALSKRCVFMIIARIFYPRRSREQERQTQRQRGTDRDRQGQRDRGRGGNKRECVVGVAGGGCCWKGESMMEQRGQDKRSGPEGLGCFLASPSFTLCFSLFSHPPPFLDFLFCPIGTSST